MAMWRVVEGMTKSFVFVEGMMQGIDFRFCVSFISKGSSSLPLHFFLLHFCCCCFFFSFDSSFQAIYPTKVEEKKDSSIPEERKE